MSISAINPSTTPVLPQAKPASDGDSAAKEAAESSATKLKELQNGGIAPKAATPGTATTPTAGSSVNKVV